jgi:hypothetical protein
VETGAGRRGRGQRLLYWFRTPPGVRVGRAPVDEEAMRLLEQNNPGVEFDWARLLKEPTAEAPPRRERDGREGREGRDGRERRDRREPRPPQRTRPMETSGTAVTPLPPEVATELQAQAEAADVRSEQHAESIAADAASETVEQDALEDAPAATRIGREAVTQLRARYVDIVARLDEKPMDDSARAELKASIERLNPDAWRTPDEVASALEQYESIFESIRSVVGRQPRRRV